MPLSLYLLPLMGAVIGGLVTLLAITLFFYPKKPISLGVITIQGIFPKHASHLAKRLGTILAKEVDFIGWLQSQLDSSQVKREVNHLLDQRLDILVNVLKQQIPMGEMFLTKTLTERLKGQAKVELIKMLPEIPNAFGASMSGHGAVSSLVEQTLSNVNPEEIKNEVKTMLWKDILSIIGFGTLLGLVIGLLLLAAAALSISFL